MDQVLQSIRGLFVEDAIANTKKENASLVIDGDLFPIPSLRTLAFQSLVLISFPIEEFLPGVGFEEDARNLLLLTRECVGKYKLVELEDSLVYADGTEGSEEDEKNLRPKGLKRPGVVLIVKTRLKKWKIGRLLTFCPAGCLRHVDKSEDGDKMTEQDWIEGNNLVTHGFIEWGRSEETDNEDADDNDEGMDQDDTDDKKGDSDEEKFGVESKVVITFYEDRFVYREGAVNTKKCCKKNCSYEYKIEASFTKI